MRLLEMMTRLNIHLYHLSEVLLADICIAALRTRISVRQVRVWWLEVRLAQARKRDP